MEAFASEGGEEKDETDGLSPGSPTDEADSALPGPPLAYTPSLLMRQVTKYSLGPPEQQVRSMRSLKQNKATGRNQAVNTNLRPDLWRVVYDTVRQRSKVEELVGKVVRESD